MASPRRILPAILASLTAGLLLATALLGPILQDPAYHDFADASPFLGIPHFLNVVSNLPMVCVGLLGVLRLRRGTTAFVDARERRPYFAFFLGITLTGAGSAWYHLAPDDARLFWDRLPIALTLMAFTSAMLADRLDARTGAFSLVPLLGTGAASVLYWRFTGDLRAYGFVHFYPGLLIPLLLILAPCRYSRGGDVWGVLCFFALTVVGDLLDRPIFALGQMVSGHTLKHCFAAVAAWRVLRMLARRRPVICH